MFSVFEYAEYILEEEMSYVCEYCEQARTWTDSQSMLD